MIQRASAPRSNRSTVLYAFLLTLGLLAGPAAPAAFAGMPMVLLSEVATDRVEVISFFVFVVLTVALAVKRMWNSLRRDFPSLPRLAYRRALVLVALLGLAFNLVLTMISGARELMTPGAWQREGATYSLDEAYLGRGASGNGRPGSVRE